VVQRSEELGRRLTRICTRGSPISTAPDNARKRMGAKKRRALTLFDPAKGKESGREKKNARSSNAGEKKCMVH